MAVLYFLRPSYHVALRALVEDSPMIAEAVKMTPERNFETGSTTKVWVERRVKYSSMKDRTVCPLRRLDIDTNAMVPRTLTSG